MKASTRRWMSLSALGLLALDLGAFAVAAPHARGWFERVQTSGVLRTGALAVRNLERAGTRGAEQAGFALLTHFTRRSGRAYAFILGATPPAMTGAQAPSCPRGTRIVMVEAQRLETGASDGPASCPLSSCPGQGAAPESAPGSSAIGLPTSALRVTVE